jgi:hypothetical protein
VGENTYTNVLLIDSQVEDYQTIVTSTNSSTFPIVYSTSSTKNELFTLLQTNFTSISRIGLVFISSAENSKMFLDNTLLFLKEDPLSVNVNFLIDVINQFNVKNIDFLACNTLNYPNWVSYYDTLTQNTGVIVGASNDKTGNIKYGGNWIMESSSEVIDLIYFTQSIQYYTYLLDTQAWTNSAIVLAGDSGASVWYNRFLYFPNINYLSGYISQIDTNGGVIQDWYKLVGVQSLCSNGADWMFATATNYNVLYKISLLDWTIQWSTGAGSKPYGVVYLNNYVYVCAAFNNTIYRYLGTGTTAPAADPTWSATGIVRCKYLATYGGVLYCSADTYNIYQALPSAGNAAATVWLAATDTQLRISGLAVYGNTLYVAGTSGLVAKIYTVSLLASSPVLVEAYAVTSYVQAMSVYKGNLYPYFGQSGAIGQYTLPALPMVCFKEDTKILTDKGYILIQDLRKGDLVKTLNHDYMPIDMIGKRAIEHHTCKERIPDQLYKCSQSEYPDIFEPLIITGCHSVLVDEFTSEEQREKTKLVLGRIFVTDNKYRLPACVDDRATVYEKEGLHIIYHIALENDAYLGNYGIYANGLLVETCSKRYLKELSNMTLIE